MEEMQFNLMPNPRKSKREKPRAGGAVFRAEKRGCSWSYKPDTGGAMGRERGGALYLQKWPLTR